MLNFYIVLGAIFGSFLNVLIHRLPINRSIISPSSHCIYCKVSIPWYYNIPILSFLFLKGSSNCCNRPISIRYLFVEIISVLLWVWCYYYVFNINDQILFLIISSSLLVIIFTDYNHFYIPIELNILMFISCLFLYIYIGFDLWYHFFSMLLLSGYFLVLMFLISFLLKKDAMGYGDIILIGVMGFWLGLIDGLIIIFMASVLSIVHWFFLKFANKKEEVILPFGSTISVSAILIYILKITLHIDTNFF